ncbi:MAG: FAD-dependent oxidoreductase [Planctomycetales bacterium]|nr:FAD-dependent oxidoreductase [Planctomycetales bacterium]
MNKRPNVIVVGGGVIGCWTAWHLLQRGCDVTLVERDTIGSGASSGNCGYICPSHVHPLCGPGAVINGLRTMAKFGGALSIPPRWDPTLWRWLWQFAKHCNANDFHQASLARHAILQSSRQQYSQFAALHAANIQWQEKGLLLVYRSDRDFQAYEASVDELRREFEIQVDQYDAKQICQLEPTVRDDLAGGWHFPGDAHLSPVKLLQQLLSEIKNAGGVIRQHTPIIGLRFDGRQLSSIQTDGGESLAADAFVFTTGAESDTLGRQLGINLPIVPGKGYSVTIGNAEGMPTTPMIFEDDHVAVTPLGESFRIGSTMQLTGFSRSLPPHRIELLKRSARRHLRLPLPVGPETQWTGWRPMMADGVPCIDRSPRAANAYIAAGNGMIGMATAPATGKLVAELALSITPHIDPHPYRARRFNNTDKS